MKLLLEICYNFTGKDLPEAIEGPHKELCGLEQGWFVRVLGWNAGALVGYEEEEGKASVCKSRVLEIVG